LLAAGDQVVQGLGVRGWQRPWFWLDGGISDLRHVHGELTLGGLNGLRPCAIARAGRFRSALIPCSAQEGGDFVFHGALQDQTRTQTLHFGQSLVVVCQPLRQ
jgi:hypothetical protein